MANEDTEKDKKNNQKPADSVEWGQHGISDEQLTALGDRVSGLNELNQDVMGDLQPGLLEQPLPGMVDLRHEGREQYDMDIDRMVNEGLGGGTVTLNNGLIDDTTTDTMTEHRDQEE